MIKSENYELTALMCLMSLTSMRFTQYFELGLSFWHEYQCYLQQQVLIWKSFMAISI